LAQTDKKKWDDIYKRGVELETAGNYAGAAERYLAAAEIDDSYADLQFRLGHCYWAMGEYDKARERYVRARELDTLRFRADNRINQIIREMAAKAEKGVYLVDAAKTFEKHSPQETAGAELFYEHPENRDPNSKGNYLLAKTILEQVQRILPDRIKSQEAANRPLLTEAQCAEYLAYTDWDRCRIADEVLNNFVKKPPFTNQLYHDKCVRRMEQEFDSLKVHLQPESLKDSATKYRQAIENDNEEAAKICRRGLRFAPGAAILHGNLGILLNRQGQQEEAVKELNIALELDPNSAKIRAVLEAILKKPH
jgi:tetratricopeptide (TPR) repeat protein